MDNTSDTRTGQVVFDPENPHLGGNIYGGDSRCEDHNVWDYLIDRFKPRSVCDVGCGEGHLMKYFFDRGILVYGVDGLRENQQYAWEYFGLQIMVCDYNKGVCLPVEVDMTIACEFVEHVEAKYIHNYLPQFCECKHLVFTHAVPGQQGHHHVNCQSDEYWIDLLTKIGFTWLEEETMYARSLVNASFWGTILIFKRQ
jgi:hypothetical protein